MRILFFFFITVLLSCANSSNQDNNSLSNKPDSAVISNNTETVIHTPKPEEEPLPELIRLSDKNVVEHLSKWAKEDKSSRVKITTPQGEIIVRLYEDTPLHRASFIHLIKEKYYHFVEITRVEKKHVVQGGNSQEEAKATQRFILGNYTIPAEIKSHHIHKKGALALARDMDDNPDKRSAPYDFYFVHGRKSGGAELYNIQKEKGIKYSDNQKNIYKKTGGTPHLDREFTVFGEITSGLSVLEKIANLEVDAKNWPKDDLVLSMEILD